MPSEKIEAEVPVEVKKASDLKIMRMMLCRLTMFSNGDDPQDQEKFEALFTRGKFEEMDIARVEFLAKNMHRYLTEKAPEMVRYANIIIKMANKTYDTPTREN